MDYSKVVENSFKFYCKAGPDFIYRAHDAFHDKNMILVYWIEDNEPACVDYIKSDVISYFENEKWVLVND